MHIDDPVVWTNPQNVNRETHPEGPDPLPGLPAKNHKQPMAAFEGFPEHEAAHFFEERFGNLDVFAEDGIFCPVRNHINYEITIIKGLEMGANKWFTVSGLLFLLGMSMAFLELLSQSSCSPAEALNIFARCKIVAQGYFSISLGVVFLAVSIGITGALRKQKKGLLN